MTDSYTFDNADQMASITDAMNGSNFATFSYTRDSANQVQTAASTGVGETAQTYSYNSLEQLGAATTGGRYGYDAADNLIRHGVSTQASDPANQLEASKTGGPTVAGGGYHTLTLRADGSVWAVGRNQHSQLGLPSTTASVSLPTLVGGLPAASAVTASAETSFALSSAGGVWAWGDGLHGELGNNTFNDLQATPVQVTNLTSGVTALSADGFSLHALAVKAGAVYAWGSNSAGQLGDGTTTNRSVPVQPAGITGTVASVAAGGTHSLALTSDGHLWAWGDNTYGELGDGTTISRTTPELLSGISHVTAISAGNNMSTALKADGTVWSWGSVNNSNLLTPTQVAGLSSITSIVAGDYHWLALKADGSVWAWGDNGYGEIGNNTTNYAFSPVQVVTSGATAIAAGFDTSYVSTNNGNVDAFGYNGYGQLANNTTTDVHTPVPATGLAPTQAMAGGGYHALQLRLDGTVWAVGRNQHSQLGLPSTTASVSLPSLVAGLPVASAVATSAETSFALSNTGGLWAWGDGLHGELGNNTFNDLQATPVQVTNLTSGVTALSANSFSIHALAVKSGAVYAWGSNSSGQLGDGTTTNRSVPVQPAGITGTVASVAAGGTHSLALTSDGHLWAWGDNTHGELGDGTTTSHTTPEMLSGISGVKAITAGDNMSFALKTDGTVWAWGSLNNVNTPSPAQMSGLSNITSIVAGSFHLLALKADSSVWAWGDNFYGEIGVNYPNYAATAVKTIASGAVGLGAGWDNSDIILNNGNVDTLGYNGYGQLANNTTTDQHTPAGATGLASTASVYTSYSYDTRGNRTTISAPYGQTATFGYDQANRLNSYSAGATTATYHYTGAGLRTSKTVNGNVSTFTWDTATAVPLLLSDGSNNYIYGPDGNPLEQVDASSNVSWLHHDQLGTTRALTNSTGTVVGTASYDSYGNPTATSGSATTPLGFAGQYTDPESGLIYLRNRYYDPTTAQFLTRDPLVALNRSAYGYVNNSPLNGTDPSGLLLLRGPDGGPRGSVRNFV